MAIGIPAPAVEGRVVEEGDSSGDQVQEDGGDGHGTEGVSHTQLLPISVADATQSEWCEQRTSRSKRRVPFGEGRTTLCPVCKKFSENASSISLLAEAPVWVWGKQ